MKPSLNAISPKGVKVVSFSLDTCGFFARSMEDLQLIAEVFGFATPQPTIPLVQDSTIAFVKTPFWDMAGPGTIDAMSKAAEILAGEGATIVHVELPPRFRDPKLLKKMHKTVLKVEGQAAFLEEYRIDKKHQLDPKIRGFVENKGNFSFEDMLEAMDMYSNMRTDFDEFAAKYSAIITPSAQDIAPLGLDDTGDSSFNFLWTGLHTPTIHIPAFKGEKGLQVGLTVVAGRLHDERLLQISTVLSKPLMSEGGCSAMRLPRYPTITLRSMYLERDST